MCWSPTADLVAGCAITAVGALCVASTRRARDLPLATLPVLLGVHQLIESVVWRNADNAAYGGRGNAGPRPIRLDGHGFPLDELAQLGRLGLPSCCALSRARRRGLGRDLTLRRTVARAPGVSRQQEAECESGDDQCDRDQGD